MYKNQYFIADVNIVNSCGLRKTSFNNLDVYSHPSLRISTTKKGTTEVLLLGFIINPLDPQKSDDEIVSNVAEICGTKESLFKEIQKLSGRFILLYHNASDFIAMNDACSLKQLYYGFTKNNTILTSSPKMFLDLYGNDLEISDAKLNFINMTEYKNGERAWIGDKCIDNRLMKVLPNHFLDIVNRRVHRIPIYYEHILNERDTLEYSSVVLEGSISAITRRYHVVQALTAGWDSRTLLAASKNVKENITFFVFDYSKSASKAIYFPEYDVLVPRKLSASLGLHFEVIEPEELQEDFLAEYKKEHIFPRMLPKTSEIQYHYHKYSNVNAVRVSGVCAEIARCKYGYTNRKIGAKMLNSFFGCEGNEYVRNEINAWIDDAEKYSKEYRIPILDLFFWEQRIANWGAMYPFEQDIAIEEFCPFNNKNLLLNLLRINFRRRYEPTCAFFHSLIGHLWKDALVEPINPRNFRSYLQMIAGRSSMLKYYRLRTLNALSNLKRI